ncbi:hypothetical protein BCAH1134_C0457 (plasmid) [Bacillus cereus AH1134]|nr:hypothetical protein BCAH1134_C0457 [Bacillus cereus AH1134]
MNNYVYSRKTQDNFLKSSWFFLYKMNFVILFISPIIYFFTINKQTYKSFNYVKNI